MPTNKKVYVNSIANWPESDRPREKLLKHGPQSLSDAKLLTILIRSGVKGSSALDLSRQLLRKFKTLRLISVASGRASSRPQTNLPKAGEASIAHPAC